MSDHAMLELRSTPAGKLHSSLPATRELTSWYTAIAGEIDHHLTPAHASLLAVPVASQEGGWSWRAPGADARAFESLPPADRRALSRAIGVIISDIRRLAESGRAPALAAATATAVCDVPDWDDVFAVDGRPVLAAWGHREAGGQGGVLGRLDDGVRWRPPPRLPWPLYAWSFGAIALLALAAGLLLPFGGRAMLPAPAACVAAPGQLDLLAEQNRAIARGDDLKLLLATLDQEIGRRALQCPLPVAPAPAAAPPAPHADLPKDRWDRHDLSMLEGCWTNTTELQTVTLDTGTIRKVRKWQFCFDRSGGGHQSILWSDGGSCRGPLRATFADDGKLVLADTERCTGANNFMLRSRSVCERIDDNEASCTLTSAERPQGSQTGRFRR